MNTSHLNDAGGTIPPLDAGQTDETRVIAAAQPSISTAGSQAGQEPSIDPHGTAERGPHLVNDSLEASLSDEVARNIDGNGPRESANAETREAAGPLADNDSDSDGAGPGQLVDENGISGDASSRAGLLLAGHWASMSEAQIHFDLSDRTLKRRIVKGTVASRLVPGERGGTKREIWIVDENGEDDMPSQRAGQPQTPRVSEPLGSGTVGASSGLPEEAGGSATSPIGASEITGGTAQRGVAGQAIDPLTEHLMGEVKFLRNTVEQGQRENAELRATLRDIARGRVLELKAAEAEMEREIPETGELAPETAPAAVLEPEKVELSKEPDKPVRRSVIAKWFGK